jgi:hypothetical protein
VPAAGLAAVRCVNSSGSSSLVSISTVCQHVLVVREAVGVTIR